MLGNYPGWQNPAHLAHLRNLCRNVCAMTDSSRTVLDVGCFLGRTTFNWSSEVRAVFAIDDWLSNMGPRLEAAQLDPGQFAKGGVVYNVRNEFYRNLVLGDDHPYKIIPVQVLPLATFTWPLRGPSLIYIDHTVTANPESYNELLLALVPESEDQYSRWRVVPCESKFPPTQIILSGMDDPKYPWLPLMVEGFANALNFTFNRLPEGLAALQKR